MKNINKAYADYADNPNRETLTKLFSLSYSYAFSVASRWKLADPSEVAQIALISIWQSLDKYKGNCKFSTWIHRIALNRCTDFYRKKKRQAIYIDDDFANHENVSIEMPNLFEYELDSIPKTIINDEEKKILQAFIENRDFEFCSKKLGISELDLKRKLNNIKNKTLIGEKTLIQLRQSIRESLEGETPKFPIPDEADRGGKPLYWRNDEKRI